METIELKKFIREIGDSVHSMNTIAVGLSKLNENNLDIPKGLEISWQPKNIKTSKMKSRNYAEKSAIIFSVESFYVYLNSISQNPFWIHPEINFNKIQNKSKSDLVYDFLSQIPDVPEEIKILAELTCLWRNRIVHLETSNSKLNNSKIGQLKSKKDFIYQNYHHFDVDIALDNYNNKKITLKDSSTLITILIIAARKIDKFLFNEFSLQKDYNRMLEILEKNEIFGNILNQQNSEKKTRQIKKFVSLNYSFLDSNQIETILELLISKRP